MSMNLIIVAGRLASDPTLSTVNDIPCTTFSLASDTKVKDANSNYIPIFYRVTAWRRMAENVAQYLHKGDQVTVQGDLSLRNYVDREGQNRTSVQISANHVEFPSKRNSVAASGSVPSGAVPGGAENAAADDDDRLPF